ncbi:MAG: putative lipid II flippase FtsW [bacterium]
MASKSRVDIALFLITITLVGIGVLMIYSSSAIFAKQHTGDTYYFFKRQLIWVTMGLIGLFCAWKFNYHKLQEKSWQLFLFGVCLISLTIIPGIGYEISGATRWLKIWFISFQPSELMRIIFIIYLTDFIVRRGKEFQGLFKGFLPPLLLLGLVSVILLKQPHLGMVVLLGMATMAILFVGGCRMQYLIALVLLAIPTVYFLIQCAPYRARRLMVFLNPWADPEHKGYHIIQSLIALGSGGLYGQGLGEGKLKLFYLPQSSTDFIFAVIGEEGGFLLTAFVIILFVLFAFAGLKISLLAADAYGSLLAFGITALIILQSLLNIGVVTGVVPTTGMPLPFISFGGSSLLINMIGVGIILNIAKYSLQQSFTSRLHQ